MPPKTSTPSPQIFWTFQDELPADMTEAQYGEYLACSRIIRGVRQFPFTYEDHQRVFLTEEPEWVDFSVNTDPDDETLSTYPQRSE